jgi:hypothetical protein
MKLTPEIERAMRSAGLDPEALRGRPAAEPVAPRGRPKARYTKPGDDGMNKTERRYAAHLEMLRIAGEVYAWSFQPEKFRLANTGDACFYTPDFRVLLNDGTVEFRETKGFMQDDALVKIKWFVAQHPYPLVVIRWIKGEWQEERYTP